MIFLLKQKTEYDLRISDWSSDVCSSDLPGARPSRRRAARAGSRGRGGRRTIGCRTAGRCGTAPPRPGSGAVRLRGDPGTWPVRSAWKCRRIVPNRTAWRQTLSSPAHPAPSKGELQMSRLSLVDPAATTAERKVVLDKIHGEFGPTPNMFKADRKSTRLN